MKPTVNLMSISAGILSTHSREFEGYPFGSLQHMHPLSRMINFYFSDLGQHTKNLNHDSKSCFTMLSK